VRYTTRMTTIVLASLVIPTAVSTLVAQAQPGLSSEALASPCALLSAAEVNQATGRRDYHDGEVLADGASPTKSSGARRVKAASSRRYLGSERSPTSRPVRKT
jgi:hypothetical protein